MSVLTASRADAAQQNSQVRGSSRVCRQAGCNTLLIEMPYEQAHDPMAGIPKLRSIAANVLMPGTLKNTMPLITR